MRPTLRATAHIVTLVAIATTGCTESDDSDPAGRDDLAAPIMPALETGNRYASPNIGDGFPFLGNGSFTFLGPQVPGTASATDAPVMDPYGGPVGTIGTGAFDITIDGQNFQQNTTESIAAVFVDDSTGMPYMVVSAFHMEVNAQGQEIGTVVHIVVPEADAVPSSTVALDGNDRLALFATGDISQPMPSLAGAAVSGTVTFTNVGTAVGDLVSASIAADFGEIDWATVGGGGGGGGGGTGQIVAGSYDLQFDTGVQIFCDGDLAGQESQFASITIADLGYVSGPATVSLPGPADTVELDGGAVNSSFGTTPLILQGMPDAPPGMVGAMIPGSGPGPAGTTFAGTFVALDGEYASATSIPGFAGQQYMNAAQTGACGVAVMLELTAP